MFPYIQFEEGVEWNVPYDRVTIRDFLRTFPEAEEKGILVQANNMGGDGIQIAQAVLQGWNGLAVLWRVNPSWKQNLFMTGLLWAVGAVTGMLLQLLPL